MPVPRETAYKNMIYQVKIQKQAFFFLMDAATSGFIFLNVKSNWRVRIG